VPIGLGEALGSAYEAGTAGYQGAQQNAIQQLLVKQKLDEAKREQALQKLFMNRIPGMTTGATTAPSLPVEGQQISGLQAASLPVENYGIGPTTQRAAMIGQVAPTGLATLPAVSVTGRERPDIFSTLTPDQALIAAMNPKAAFPKIFEESLKTESFNTLTPTEAASLGLDASGKYQQNIRTGQITSIQAPKEEFEVVTGLKAEALGLSGLGKWQVNKTTKQATQVAETPGTFGGGLQAKAYDIILDGVSSGKTNTAEYALAFRELSKPVPTERVRADGSIEVVYTQPAPLPASIPKPTFRGNIPSPTKPVAVVPSTGQVAPAPVTARATAPAPVVSPTSGATAVPPPAGVKASPMAASKEEITSTRKAVNAGVDFVAALDKLENMVRTQGMQIGGLGEVGAAQEVVYEDLLTKIRLAAELGVLNKEDLPRIQAQLGSPTALSTYIKGLGGPSAFYSQIGELKNKTIEETLRKNLQFGQPVMNLPSTFTVTRPIPARPSTPPAILKLLDQYPGRTQ
jgi:hypothetical protein